MVGSFRIREKGNCVDMSELPAEVAGMDEETLVYMVTMLAMRHPEDYKEIRQMHDTKNSHAIRF